MSFLSDTVLSGGSTRLHVARHQTTGRKQIQKSKSHGGFLSPLSKLARSSVQSIGEVIGSHHIAPVQDALDEDAGRKQILYLRMKDVGTRARHPHDHMLTAVLGRDLQRMESRSDGPRYLGREQCLEGRRRLARVRCSAGRSTPPRAGRGTAQLRREEDVVLATHSTHTGSWRHG